MAQSDQSTIDAYSPCPGGTGKKIKFCCNDLLPDLQKIDRLLQGEQPVAALRHINRVLEKNPDKACLLAIRGLVLRGTSQRDEAKENSRLFVEKHPENQVALAEAAILASGEDGTAAAMDFLQRAIESGGGELQARVYEAIGATARVAMIEGFLTAARALYNFQVTLNPQDPEPPSTLMQLFGSQQAPLLLRDEPCWLPFPPDAPWLPRMTEALELEAAGKWRQAAEKLALLAAELETEPAPWQQLARLKGQIADTAGQVEALRRFAALDVPWDDAVEAEAIAMLLSEDPLGDRVEISNINWEVEDAGRLEEALAFDRRCIKVPFNPAELADDDTPPPKSVYWLLSCREPAKDEPLTGENMPRMLGQMMLFGRQTDRAARLELLGVSHSEREAVEQLLRGLGGDALSGEPRHEVVAHMSASQEMLQAQWWPPEDADPTQVNAVVEEYQRDALLQRWPELKLGALDGRSPADAVNDESLRRRVAAAMLVLQAITERGVAGFDFAALADKLSLPAAEPIDPNDQPLDELPMIRYERVIVEKLDDDGVKHGLRKSMAFRAPNAMERFAQAVVDRPSLAGSDEQMRAFTVLAQLQTDPAKVEAIYQQGREALDAAGRSHAHLDLSELAMRFTRGEAEHIRRLIDHIQSDHLSEPGIREGLTRMLVQFGVLNPDGTPGPAVTRARQAQQAMAAAAAGGGMPQPGPAPEQSAGESGLWTPDAGPSQTGDSGGGKLWTPD
jgi:hypothetical protein